MQGMLYLCATPIGNLGDITIRVLDTLKEVDLIAAEDTRHTVKLLNHYNIKTPMTSYHEFNKIEKAEYLTAQMEAGKHIALVTDAGTPGISDPGEELVKLCYEKGLEVTALPGPAACVTALTISGLPARRFCFEAFLPVDKQKRLQVLEDLKEESRTIVIYESPHHLVRTMKELAEALGDRNISLCRELTKKYETVFRTTIKQAIIFYEENMPKGEFVLVIQGKSYEEKRAEDELAWSRITIKEHMQIYLDGGMDKKDAMKRVARERGISKREVYGDLI